MGYIIFDDKYEKLYNTKYEIWNDAKYEYAYGVKAENMYGTKAGTDWAGPWQHRRRSSQLPLKR